MATVLGSKGIIENMEDFIGAEWIVAETAVSGAIGALRVIGDGTEDTDSGIVNLESDGLSGVGQFTTTNENKHDCCVATSVMFDVALMGTLVFEARIRLPALANREVFFGISDVNTDALSFEDDLVHGNGTTITNTASDFAGFLLSAELADSADWHSVYNGGSAAAVTASGSLDLDDAAVAGEWQVLRMEVDSNGTVRWLIDNVVKATVTGAVSTSVDMAMVLGVESQTTTALTLDVDYVYFRANRDWTV